MNKITTIATRDNIMDIGQKLKILRQMRGFTLESLAEACGVSKTHLHRIEKGVSKPAIDTLEKILRVLEMSISEFYDWNPLQPTASTTSMNESIKIPILNYVPAGYPALIPDPNYVAGYIEVPHTFREKGLFGFKVWGNSMEPELREGDIAIVSPNKAPVKGDIVVCTYNEGETAIKKYYPSEDYVSLVSINPEYEPIIIAKNRIKFIGKVIMVMRHYK